jgi:hypothetical protein
LLAALGSTWASADHGLPRRSEVVREVNLVKPPHEDLRIRWSALVHEEGGEFRLSRQGLGGAPSVVARVRPRVDGRYEVAEHGAIGSWIYELRYRDRRGREHLLVTIRLNVESVDAGHGVLTAGAHGQPPAALTAALLPPPDAMAALPAVAAEGAARGPDRWPPTPPP